MVAHRSCLTLWQILWQCIASNRKGTGGTLNWLNGRGVKRRVFEACVRARYCELDRDVSGGDVGLSYQMSRRCWRQVDWRRGSDKS